MACKKCAKVDTEKFLVSFPVEIAGGDFNSGGATVRGGLGLGGMVNSQLGAAFGRELELLDILFPKSAISERLLFRKGTTCRLRPS